MTAILRSLCCCQFPPVVYSCSSSSCLFLNHFHSITSLQSSPAIVAPRRPSSLGEYICRVAYYCRTSFSAALFCCVSTVLSRSAFSVFNFSLEAASFLSSRQAHRDHRHRRDPHHAQAGGRRVHTTARFYCARRLSDKICVPRSVEQMNQKTHKSRGRGCGVSGGEEGLDFGAYLW